MIEELVLRMKMQTKKEKPARETSLFHSRAGSWIKILSLPAGTLRAQFIRVGIHEGERVRCIERLPGGTMILQKNRQQIAVGHQLAKQISVLLLPDEEARR